MCWERCRGDRRHIYTFENVCRENPEIKLEDGTHKIFLCAGSNRNDCSNTMKDFLEYITSKKTNGELSQRLQNEVEKSRSHEEWKADYMTLLEKYEEKIEEGRELGRQEERKNTEAERKRADAAENRANVAESKANKAELRIKELEAKLASAAGR